MYKIEKEVILEGEFGSIKVHALIDTGASVTVIPKDIAMKIGARPYNDFVELVGFDGSRQVCRRYALKIGFPTLGKEPIGPFVVAVCDAVDRPIIGMDIMRTLGIVVDVKSGDIYIKDETWETVKSVLAVIGGIAILAMVVGDKKKEET